MQNTTAATTNRACPDHHWTEGTLEDHPHRETGRYCHARSHGSALCEDCERVDRPAKPR